MQLPMTTEQLWDAMAATPTTVATEVEDASTANDVQEDVAPPTVATKIEDASTANDVEEDAAPIAEKPPFPKKFNFNKARPLHPESFPNVAQSGNSVLPTIPNLEFLLTSYGISVFYNVITKGVDIRFPGIETSIDNADEALMNHIISLAILNNMSTSRIPAFVLTLADRNQINPVADWVTSIEWDGRCRLTEFYATLTTRADYPTELKEILMYCWILSVVAATFKSTGFKARGVLTFQGEQGLGKTSWVKSLIPIQPLCDQVIKVDMRLDVNDKDKVLSALSHLIVELGEVEGCLKSDISKLKSFLTNDFDKIRKPYARTQSEFARRTLFVATVNDPQFLTDSSNTRFWTIPVIKVDYQHNVDMQQLWAQLKVDFDNGASWWLNKEQEKLLETFNSHHKVVSALQERIMSELDISRIDAPGLKAFTATEVLAKVGIKLPTNGQSKECNAILRELLGDSKRIGGFNKWRVPFSIHKPFDDDDY